jgi:uncharacterized membrane protein YraQ (UPF0718 family)
VVVFNSAQTLVTIFLGIFIEAVPFLLLGTLASGIVEVLVRRKRLARLIPSNRVLSPLIGVVLGLAFPVCECGAVPLTRRLFRKGFPLSAGVAFLLAAPVINPIVIASTWAAFGNGVIFWGRIGLAVVIAALVGLLFALAPGSQEVLRPAAWVPAAPTPVDDPGGRNWGRDVRQVLVIAGQEFFDMGRYLVVGALLAAAMQTLVPQPVLADLGKGPLSSVLAMQALAYVLSVCSTVDAFLALSFVNVFPAGSILAFLVFGAMVDLKSTSMFLGVFRRIYVLYLILLPLALTTFLCMLVNALGGG